jgi:hypothetical protein
VRLEILGNASTPAELVLDAVASVLRDAPDRDLPDVLAVAGGVPDVEIPEGAIEEALVRLSKSRVRDPDVRRVAACHERTPPGALTRLARAADSDIRAVVAGNARTPPGALDNLSTDPDEEVRTRVAGNESTLPATLVALSYDASPQVRQGLADRISLAPDVLERLLDDESQTVRAKAFMNPGAREVFPRRGESFDDAVADLQRQQRREPTDRATLHRRAEDRRAEVRKEVAFDPAATADILDFLGGDPRSKHVRASAAANPSASANLLAMLAGDSEELVRQTVAFNGATPTSVLIELAGRSVDMALLVALNPDVPDEVLGALTKDAEPLVRFVAKGVSTSRRASISAGNLRPRFPLIPGGALSLP